MKKLVILVIAAIALFALSACGKSAPTSGDDYLGIWTCDRASIEITLQDDDYLVRIHWGSSAYESSDWEYTCEFYEDEGILYADRTGTRTDYTYAENGDVASEEQVYVGGAATFALGKNGKLTWEDVAEDAGTGMEFEYVE